MLEVNEEIELKRKLRLHLSELMDLDIKEIKDESNLIQLGATSMVIVQLYVILQEEYGIALENSLNLYKESISIDSIIKSIKKLYR